MITLPIQIISIRDADIVSSRVGSVKICFICMLVNMLTNSVLLELSTFNGLLLISPKKTVALKFRNM